MHLAGVSLRRTSGGREITAGRFADDRVGEVGRRRKVGRRVLRVGRHREVGVLVVGADGRRASGRFSCFRSGKTKMLGGFRDP